jgi:DNA (cytosine-5)-methyltransferase 1
MTHGSLFSGMGGFDLAAEWMGWENVFHCEWNEFGQKVLKYYWPNAESFIDITKTDFTKYADRIDVLTGGFPCQPYSTAGKRLGKEDKRHLWPHMYRAIQEIKPSWVVGENVRGLVSWNGGLVFHEVQADLENAGYQVQPFLLPACGVNAPHQRYRIWFVAYSDNKRRGAGFGKIQEKNGEIPKRNNNAKFSDTGKPINGWQNFPTVSPICNGDDGLSNRLDSITFSKWRNESIKAGGNAIVPQVALQIFKAIQAYEDGDS